MDEKEIPFRKIAKLVEKNSFFVEAHIAEIVKGKASGVSEKELKQLITEAQSDKKLVETVQGLEEAVMDDLKNWAKQLNSNTQIILDNYHQHIETNGTALKGIDLSDLSSKEAVLFLRLDKFDRDLIDKYKKADEACMSGFNFSLTNNGVR